MKYILHFFKASRWNKTSPLWKYTFILALPSQSQVAVIIHKHQGIFTSNVYRELRMCRNAWGYADTGYFNTLLNGLEVPGHTSKKLLMACWQGEELWVSWGFCSFFFFLISVQRTKSQTVRIYLETHNSSKATPSQYCCCPSSHDGWVTFCSTPVLLIQQELNWNLRVSLRINAPWLESKTCLISARRMQSWSTHFTAIAH